jgi:hypothetical protein
VGIAGSLSLRACTLSAVVELERQHRVSDAALTRSSYRYLRQGCKSPTAFERCESWYYRDLQPPSSHGSTSHYSDLPPRT